jgi:hypothetical protein
VCWNYFLLHGVCVLEKSEVQYPLPWLEMLGRGVRYDAVDVDE